MKKPTLKHINNILGTDIGGNATVTTKGVRTIKLWNLLKPEEIEKLKESLPGMFPEQAVTFSERTLYGSCTKQVTAVTFTPKD